MCCTRFTVNAIMNQQDAADDRALLAEKIARLSSLSAPRSGAGLRGGQRRNWKTMPTIDANSEASDGPNDNPPSADEIAARKAKANQDAERDATAIFILVRGQESVRFCVHGSKVKMIRGLTTYEYDLERARKVYASLRQQGFEKW
jgi:hypothetical protein